MRIATTFVAAVVAAATVVGCQTAPKTQAEKEGIEARADTAIQKMKAEDPTLDPFLDRAHAYILFPTVGEGGFIVAGGYGRGLVYQGGRQVGYADITKATVGAQVGGQTFSQVVAFENEAAFNKFRNGDKLALTAEASVVAAKSGAAAAAQYKDGVVVFVEPKAGLMAAAAVGGQQITYVAADAVNIPEGGNARTTETRTTETRVETSTTTRPATR